MNLLETLKMDKAVFSTVSLYDDSGETEYWRTQSHQARMEALEFMRQVMYGYDPTTERIPRLIEVLKRAEH